MARFAFRTASSLLFGGMGVCLFHSVLSKIVSYFFECFGWKLKYYVYQHLEIVCKCWYLVNTRSVVKRKKESHSSKKAQSSISYCCKKFLVATKEEQEVIIVFIEVEQEINIKNNDCHVLIFNHCFQL